MGSTARIAIRVNPDVDAKTHHKIATGKAENKFGVPFAEAPALYRLASKLPNIEATGVHMHIGSQITDLTPFQQRLRAAEGAGRHAARARRFGIAFVNLGGGLGIPYRRDQPTPPSPADYARLVKDEVGDLGVRLLFEPGRMIAGNAGSPVSRVIYVKQGATKTFTIVDAAMNDLIRPTLYEAYHEILPVIEPRAGNADRGQRRGRPGMRDRRLSRAGEAAARAPSGRSHCRDDRRRLWRGARIRI